MSILDEELALMLLRHQELELGSEMSAGIFDEIAGTLAAAGCIHRDGRDPGATAPMFFREWILCAIAKRTARTGPLEEMVAIQCSDGNWNYSEYMHGMANGLLLALATIKGEEPRFLEAPERWLSDKEE